MAKKDQEVYPDLFTQIKASSPQGQELAVIEKVLRTYFSGKRDAVRTYKFVNVEIQGKRSSFKGMAVDISRSGLLLRIMDPEFASPEEMEHLMPYTARVWYHFEGGFQVKFGKSGVKARADVVRVTGYAGQGRSLILLGCRFQRPLEKPECERLGIEHADDRPPFV
jgi:hypothetical protein